MSTNLKEISYWCFCYLYSLKEITIPDSVTAIGGLFLYNCNQITSLTIPTHWERVGNRFVNNKSSFSTFRIPPSVQIINGEEVTIEEVQEFDVPSYVTKLDVESFRESRDTKITIPESVKELPYGCFASCQQLKEITIPSSITKLGKACFAWCWLPSSGCDSSTATFSGGLFCIF